MKNEFLSKVYMNLFLGLLITFLTGYVVSTNINATIFFCTGYMRWILVIAELIIAFVLPDRIHKLSGTTAKMLYLLYAALTGLALTSIFILYEIASIIWIFLVTSILFGIFAFIGKTTTDDLSKFGVYLFMGLLAILILSIINIFIYNNTLDMITCSIGIIIFLGYVAYDMKKISRLNYYNLYEDNMATIGAFSLYLDFINIFIKLLRLFEKTRD